MRRVERVVEQALWSSRLMVVFAVVASLCGALIMSAVGLLNVWNAFSAGLGYAQHTLAFADFQRKAIVYIIASIDAFLIATVLLIFGFGLYELFISRIDPAERDDRASRILIVRSLPHLKVKLASVIVMVLVVAFFKEAMGMVFNDVWELLGLAAGIVLCTGALFLSNRIGATQRAEDRDEH
jgi:uncharacterized membrane protein YqhA